MTQQLHILPAKLPSHRLSLTVAASMSHRRNHPSRTIQVTPLSNDVVGVHCKKARCSTEVSVKVSAKTHQKPLEASGSSGLEATGIPQCKINILKIGGCSMIISLI